MHCWVADASARKLTIDARNAVASFLSVLEVLLHPCVCACVRLLVIIIDGVCVKVRVCVRVLSGYEKI